MNTIKNIHKLDGVITPDKLERLDQAANLHLRHSNITFKILEMRDDKLVVKTQQGKHFSENYADVKTLIARTRELFAPFTSLDILVQPTVYTQSIVEVVTPEWIKEKMLMKGVKLKDIVTDTGIPKSSISVWVTGLKPMSQIVKAMFYFYFTR